MNKRQMKEHWSCIRKKPKKEQTKSMRFDQLIMNEPYASIQENQPNDLVNE